MSKMRGIDKYFKTVVVVAIVVLIFGAALVFLPLDQNSVELTEFIIEDGQSLGATARLLAERDLILSRYIFVGYTILIGKEKEFKAGRYLIPRTAGMRKLVDIFSSGESEADDIEVTIPEGTNIADAGLIFEKAGLIRKEEILRPEFLKLEGYLFPDTYRFGKQPSPLSVESGWPGLTEEKIAHAEDIIGKMKDNFRVKTGEIFKGLNIKKVRDVIIIASILEKEIRTEDDMRLVAGIIEKRLDLGMSLEIDATVTYGVCYPKFFSGKYCDVSLANIVDNIPVDSVYNTYKRMGLPIGPISNPGLRAIKAALDPLPSDYLFYLSAKDGSTIFSRTATEHFKARQKYLK